MLKLPSLITAIASVVFTLCGAATAATNKCVINGAVTYQQAPCPSDEVRKPLTPQPATPAVTGGFSCDGRKYCSQMKSCAEAKYFLANCPGVQMDGDNNGIPCEKQWCGRSLR